MINWKKVGEHTPTNVNKSYPNSPETPYVSCIVWVCNPETLRGGVADVVRWDTKKNVGLNMTRLENGYMSHHTKSPTFVMI